MNHGSESIERLQVHLRYVSTSVCRGPDIEVRVASLGEQKLIRGNAILTTARQIDAERSFVMFETRGIILVSSRCTHNTMLFHISYFQRELLALTLILSIHGETLTAKLS